MLETWNETAKKTKNGQPMDAFICPIAPFAAVSHGNYDHLSYTSWVLFPKKIITFLLHIFLFLFSFEDGKADVD